MRGDGNLLYSAVYNIISNTSEHIPPGGTVKVRGREEPGTIITEVADTGIEVLRAGLPAMWSEPTRAGSV